MLSKRKTGGSPRRALLLACAAGITAFSQPPAAADWLDLFRTEAERRKSELVVAVQANYPGAGAEVVADTVAAPIEQQVNGVENMLYLRSRSAADGSYRLHVAFRRGTDQDVAQVLVQNRVALALPLLPEEVKARGVAVKKSAPGALMIVGIYSPAGKQGVCELSNYATMQLMDGLCRIAGVAEVTSVGQSEYGMRVGLDAAKMAAHNLVVGDVAAALREEAAELAASQARKPPAAEGQGPAQTLPLGQSDVAEHFGNIALKADAAARALRLKDIARVEVGAVSQPSQALLDGKPAVALVIYPTAKASPRAVSSAVRRELAEPRSTPPAGTNCQVFLDFATSPGATARPADPGYIFVNLALPSGTPPERMLQALKKCDALLRGIAGVRDVLAMSENPLDTFSAQPTLLVQLGTADKRPASREQIAQAVRSRLAEVAGVGVRLPDLSGPGGPPAGRYPIDLALYGGETGKLRDLANKLAKRLQASGKLTDVWVESAAEPRPQVYIDIDRTRAATSGVGVSEIAAAIQASLGPVAAGEFQSLGRSWPIKVGLGDGTKEPGDLGNLRIRSSAGKMLPLSAVAEIRKRTGPAVIDRLNLYPMVEITANPVANASLAQIRELCKSSIAELRQELGLNEEGRWEWL
jgi:multidrug efflux pump subunit AcrB